MSEKLNVPPFYVGQKVVCIEVDPDSMINDMWNQSIKKDQIYIISNINPYPGFHIPLVMVSASTCFWKASSFSPVQESKFRAVSFEKVMEETEIICEN